MHFYKAEVILVVVFFKLLRLLTENEQHLFIDVHDIAVVISFHLLSGGASG